MGVAWLGYDVDAQNIVRGQRIPNVRGGIETRTPAKHEAVRLLRDQVSAGLSPAARFHALGVLADGV